MAYDNAGNLVSQATAGDPVTYIYDAWSRLVEVQYDDVPRAQYRYNGLNWRILKRADTSTPPDGELNQQRIMYYNANWQLLEEFINDAWDDEAADDEHDRRMQYVWGARYIDDIVLRRQFEEEDIMGPGTITSTWYHLTDTLFSTVAILDDAANLIERVSYDTYGNARHHRMADLNGDGAVDVADLTAQLGGWGEYGIGDLNRDGIVNSADTTLLNNDMVVGNALPAGRISLTDNIIGYAGYVFNAEIHGSGLYTVRHRHYSPELGRWLTRDPIGYVDGMNLYEYVRSRPSVLRDKYGLYANDGPPFITPLPDVVHGPPTIDQANCRKACASGGQPAYRTICSNGRSIVCVCGGDFGLGRQVPSMHPMIKPMQKCARKCEPGHSKKIDCDGVDYAVESIDGGSRLPWQDSKCGKCCSEADVLECFSSCVNEFDCNSLSDLSPMQCESMKQGYQKLSETVKDGCDACKNCEPFDPATCAVEG